MVLHMLIQFIVTIASLRIKLGPRMGFIALGTTVLFFLTKVLATSFIQELERRRDKSGLKESVFMEAIFRRRRLSRFFNQIPCDLAGYKATLDSRHQTQKAEHKAKIFLAGVDNGILGIGATLAIYSTDLGDHMVTALLWW
ncbi:hypothetical protein F4678DRAFT_185796 [Xylaria arbuscula]|nr:hypothetical protein F4678DRAFT_185796 [Xylaria arbuscula]